jgi:hypothetical protein
MLSGKVPLDELDDDRDILPAFARRGLTEPIPRFELPRQPMDPSVAYQIVPAYRMAPNAENLAVARIVVREGFSRDLAAELADDITTAIGRLAGGGRPGLARPPVAAKRKAARSRVSGTAPGAKTNAVC